MSSETEIRPFPAIAASGLAPEHPERMCPLARRGAPRP